MRLFLLTVLALYDPGCLGAFRRDECRTDTDCGPDYVCVRAYMCGAPPLVCRPQYVPEDETGYEQLDGGFPAADAGDIALQ